MDERIVPEMSLPTKPCPHPEKWHAYDDMATELEVLEFIRVLVLMLKPEMCIETGCYKGHGTEAIARGLEGCGHILTCDLGHENVVATKTRMRELDYEYAEVLQMSGVALINAAPLMIDFAFLDSGMDTPRIDELRALYPKLSPGGVVAIHDTNVQFGLREFHLGPTLRELNMQYIFLDTPRGITLCRKQPEIYP